MTQPQAFGRYELLERVSAGGMAEVFRARDKKRGTLVALKRILPNIAEDDEFVRMFEDEARIASQLEHPHIARTLDYGHVGDAYYIAFEFVDGRDMRLVFDRCAKTSDQPPLSFLLYVFTRIGEGLSYAHSRKDAKGEPVSIVHRDVSPHNIVVSFDGDVKLIDFGIAKAAGRLSRTQAGEIKGKFGYMSPEQIGGGEVDQRTDVFSLGICMWELLTLRRLYEAPNEIMVLEKIRGTVIQPPSSLNPYVPPELDRIVCKALAKSVDERYRSARELYRDLNALSKDTNAVATRSEIAQYMRRTFPEAGRPPDPSLIEEGDGDDLATVVEKPGQARVQETVAMAAENKGGSDLDVFEGLGKKKNTSPPVSGVAPAPPSSAPRNGPPPPPPSGRPATIPPNTLRGMASPLAQPPPPPASAPPPSKVPPPPPGRGALPIVVPPPTRPSSVPTKPASASGAPSGGLDMDWDDDQEETHIFDKEGSKSQPPPKPPPTSSSMPVAKPPPPPSSVPPSKTGNANAIAGNKRTLVGMSNAAFHPPPPPPPPPGPPSAQMRTPVPPPPPSSVGGAFARASSIPSSAVGPVGHPPPPPPPTIDPRPTPSHHPLPPPPHSFPPQQNTAPLPMPAPRPASPAYATQQEMPQLPPPPMMNRMEATALVRPPETSRVGIVVAVVTAAVFAAALAFFLLPHNGTLTVRALDSKGADVSHMQVFIDGKQTACATSPCTPDPLSPGNYSVKVVADGFDPVEKTVAIESRGRAAVEFALAGGPAATAGGTGVKVEGAQPGVKLIVDDREIGPLPAEVHDLSPGSHKVRIAGSDRYTPVEKNVTLAKDDFQDLGNVTLKVVKGKVTVTLATPGARVFLVSGTDRRELPTMPISVELDPGKPWSLVATKFGFVDYNQAVSFDDGQAEKTFNVSLDPKTATASAAPAFVQHTAPSQPSTPRPPPPPSSDTGSAPSAGDAFLNINSIPASSIVLDGKPIGNTPKLKFSVSPGSHTVTFVNAEQSFKKTVTVTVGAGETKPAIGKAD